MKKLGRVKSISDGKLVLKTEQIIKMGQKIYDNDGNYIGNAIDYFGPTLGPYVLVSTKKSPELFQGKELYG